MNVPFCGTAQAFAAVMAGEVATIFADTAGANTGINSGKLHVLTVTTLKRVTKLPDALTIDRS
jgi:tripartite-type tricarboxylate transporter receptor subunit TctC